MSNPPIDNEKIQSEDFQFVLKALLDAYRPILEEELNLANDPNKLREEAKGHPPNCDDEIARAQRFFTAFFTKEVAARTIPPAQRGQLTDDWTICLRYVICCFVFGWLVCRSPRTFRALAYYVYRYWLCVREAVGTPVANPPTIAERQDFQTLVTALAAAYKPYLTDQLATVEFPQGIPDEVFAGGIDCREGAGATVQAVEQFLASDISSALFGKPALDRIGKYPYWWICRCWCICAIQFGCCLAKSQNLIDALICLLQFFICIEECFQPIRCEVTNPTGCAEEQGGLPGITPPDVGLEIDGTASGAFFDHYILEWRQAMGQACNDNTAFTSIGIWYPGGGATGTIPVVGGMLGTWDTTFLPTASYEIRVTVFSTTGAQTQCCGAPFVLFKKLVFISQVTNNATGAFVQTPPGPFDSNADVVTSNPAPPGVVAPVGGSISVFGAAFVGDCQKRKIACFDLRAAIGFQVGPNDAGFNATLPLYTTEMLSPGPVCWNDVPLPDEIKKRLWRLDSGFNDLTVFWKHLTTLSGQPWALKPNPFASDSLLPSNIFNGPCPDLQHRCQSGQYTLLLDVTDTTTPTPTHYYDTQHVLFDNKPITVIFHGLQGVPSCQDLHINPNQPFIPPGAPCNVPWNVNLTGIAFDELIDETGPNSYPNNNFDFYSLTITKQTGEVLQVPITISPDPLNPYEGTQRRGQPGTRCDAPPQILGCPPVPGIPGQSFDVLTALDMRVFDAVCALSVPAPYSIPPTFPLPRGSCCGYTFQLYAQDQTWSDGYAGGFHHAWSLPWAICICNDLPSTTP